MKPYQGDMEDTEHVGYLCFTERPYNNRGVYVEYSGTGVDMGISTLCGGEIMNTLELKMSAEQAEWLGWALIRMANLTISGIKAELTYHRTLDEGPMTEKEWAEQQEKVKESARRQLLAAGIKIGEWAK